MGHTPENLPRAKHIRRMAESVTPTGSDNRNNAISTTATVVIYPLSETAAFVMKLARIYQQDQLAGLLEALDDGSYRFTYDTAFHGEPVSLTMPTRQRVWEFPNFPAPFEGLLPEGVQLDALLRIRKLDRNDLFGQLLAVGRDVVGSLRIEAAK